MKKSVLISTTLVVLALSATSIYAQVSGSSLITKMKAAAENFTLASELNPGQTGLQSAPVSGKKTGDILTAGEWNRVLELLGEDGDSGSSGGTSNITWANFDGSGGVAMKGSNGISSIVRVSGGIYRITFTTPKANTDYGVICTAGTSPSYLCYPHEKTTSSFLIMTGNSWANADAPFVSLIVTPFDVGTSSGSPSPALYKCTNAQSLDATNAPCYGASRNGGAGTNQYRVVSCTDNDGTRSYTMSSILNFGQLVTNKWAVSVNGGTIECDDGTVLVMDIQGGGSVGGSGWVDVPTDAADFDVNCEYRYYANYLVDDANRKWMNATSATIYIEGVSTKYLRRDLDLANNVMWGIQSSDKTKYGNRNSSGVFTVANNIQITRLQKKCD